MAIYVTRPAGGLSRARLVFGPRRAGSLSPESRDLEVPLRVLGRTLAAVASRHRVLLALVLAAVALRVVALVAIYPGIWFSDSNNYLEAAATGTLSVARVSGYALFVAPFLQAGSAGALIVTQHAIGIGIVVVLYALLLRRGVPRLLAAIAVVPAALDAYLIAIEHAIMSEAVFHAALVGAIALLLWKDRPGLVAAASAGLLLGYAGVVRSLAIPFVAIFLVYLLARRVGWRAVVAFGLAWALVAGGYAAAFKAQHGKLGFTEYDGRFLYANVARYADCSTMSVPASELALCPDPRNRLTTNAYLWGPDSPLYGLPVEADSRIRDFALRVIRDRPLTYAKLVAGGFLHYFEPGHRIGPNDYSVGPWQFPADPRRWGYPGYRGPIRPGDPARRRDHTVTEPSRYAAEMVSRPRTNAAASRFLHGYQRVVYTAGPVLAACLLVVVLAVVLRRGAWRLRLDAGLLAAAVVAALLVAPALSVFSYRYGFIAPILLPPAAALAGTALWQGSRERARARKAAPATAP